MENIIKETVISQYANSPIIVQLVEYWNQDIDPTINIAEFLVFVFSVETAKSFGLDIWGTIVNISRYLPVTDNYKYFGFYNASFDDDNQIYTPFNVKPFFNGFDYTPTITVDDETYRKMILAKAYANLAFANISALNFLINYLLGDGAGYAIDNFNMTISYTFNITLSPIQYAIIYQSGILPVPAGVGVNAEAGKLFGFYSDHNPIPAENWPWPFNVGVFNNDSN